MWRAIVDLTISQKLAALEQQQAVVAMAEASWSPQVIAGRPH
jgi:hypothetical protein